MAEEERQLFEHGSTYYSVDSGEFIEAYGRVAEDLGLRPVEDLESGGLVVPRDQVARCVRYLNGIADRYEKYGDVSVMCLEYGDDDDWNEITLDDLDAEDPDELWEPWKTFIIS